MREAADNGANIVPLDANNYSILNLLVDMLPAGEECFKSWARLKHNTDSESEELDVSVLRRPFMSYLIV